MEVGRLAARAGRTLVSGGAKGIDQSAMRGALEAGGKASGVLADSLEKTSMNRDHRNLLIDGQLVLISPYDPNAGFNVGNAMQRNKLIYALADASLVVSSDLNKGGTWAGATEQLNKFRFVPVYVRSTGEMSPGLNALRTKGALPWPNPQDVDAFETVFDTAAPIPEVSAQTGLSLFSNDVQLNVASIPPAVTDIVQVPEVAEEPLLDSEEQPVVQLSDEPSAVEPEPKTDTKTPEVLVESSPANTLFASVRDVIQDLLRTPMKDAEVAAALNVSNAQAKVWLQRLVDEGVLKKHKKPVGYIVKQSSLFE
jgi:predicted Rossmann fold nucleotide-binding protein DprA/Smf involved in DNA uptake